MKELHSYKEGPDNLHNVQCSYNTDYVRWLKLHCHKCSNICNFNFDAKYAATKGYGESS